MIYIAVLNNLIVNGSARFLNKLYANDVDIGSDVAISGKTTTGQLVINGGTNFGNLGSGNSNNAPLVIGNPNGTHIAIDYDEIQRKNNATTAGDLYLNDSGGNVYLSNGKQIYASNGTFFTPTLRATNIGDKDHVASTAYIAIGNITTLNTDQVNVKNIDAENVDVKYKLKASHYDLQTVSQLGGVFRVAPSISIPSTVTPSTNVKTTSVTVTKSSSSATITIVDNSINNGDSQGDISTTTPYIGGITWASGAYIMCSGTIGDVVTGTMFGKITTINTNSRTLTLNITSGYDGLVAGTYSASQISGLTVVLYKNHSNYPVGIELNSYGTSVGRTYIDVYGGTSNEPSVRIGNIGGLSYNGGTLENQWGIYTDNGYFKGAIVSTEGKIGGFTIDQTKLFNGTNSLTSTATGVYLGTDGIRNYNTTGSKHVTIKDGTITANSVDLTGKITATSGSISGSLVSSGIDASNITAGTLSADRIGAGSITIGKINQKVYAYSNNGQGTGYAKLFTISHTDSYRNAPISFLFHNRGKRETRVSLNYTNDQTAASAVIQNATYDGDTAFYYVSKGNAVYDVYFALAESWDDTYVTGYINQYSSGLEVEWSGSYYGTSLPSGAVEFMKLVGSIAKSTIDDYAKTATTYITDIDSNKGITIKPSNSSGNDYLQMNSSAISFYRNNVETVKLEDSAFRIGKLDTNKRNIYVTDSAVQIRNNTTPLAEYGSDIKFYDGTGNATTNIAAQIGSTGISIKKGDINLGNGTFTVSSTGNITAKDGSIGGWTISTSSISSSDTSTIKTIVAGTRTSSSTGDGVYIGSNGVLNVGKESGNYLIFDGTNLDLKTDWLRFDDSIDSIIIGKDNGSYVSVDYHSFKMIDDNENTYVYFSNLRGSDGRIIEEFVGDGVTTSFSASVSMATQVEVTIDDVVTTSYTLDPIRKTLTFDSPPRDGALIVFKYKPRDSENTDMLKAYTLGIRKAGAVGANSFAEGYKITADGRYSHAEGYNTVSHGQTSHAEGYYAKANGMYSHAEGSGTIANGMSSHAEGMGTITNESRSHAEGYGTVANGLQSHAEGYNCEAYGSASHAGGCGSIALNDFQTVIGKYNKATVTGSGTDANPYVYTNVGDYAFIIGNGSGNTTSARSNALTVDWSGNLICNNHQAGIVEAMAKTTTNANSGGVTAYWYYRKWSNNLVECWTTSSVSIAPTAANTKANRRITLPVTMPYKYSMQATIRGIPEIATCHIGLENINDNEIRLYIYESNTTPRSVDIYVIGSQ